VLFPGLEVASPLLHPDRRSSGACRRPAALQERREWVGGERPIDRVG
jgi:hypothetical protein